MVHSSYNMHLAHIAYRFAAFSNPASITFLLPHHCIPGPDVTSSNWALLGLEIQEIRSQGFGHKRSQSQRCSFRKYLVFLDEDYWGGGAKSAPRPTLGGKPPPLPPLIRRP